MAEAKLFNVGVKALIVNGKNEILLLQSAGHGSAPEPYWDIPGGRIEAGQSALEALYREIGEETGITEVDNTRFFTAVISNHEIPRGDELLGLVLMIYTLQIPEGSHVRISEEHTAYEWVDKAEAVKRLGHKYPSEFTDSLK